MTDLASLELRIESRQVGRARDELGRFVASGKSAERSASQFERSARRLSGTAGVLGKSLGGLSPIVLGLGGAAGFRGLVGILREFEDGLVGVSKTTGLAGNGLRALEQDIERMATNSSTAIDGLFGISEAAGQLGIRGRESLGGFTDAISKLADAAPSLRSDIDGTALSMGKLLSITGASADETFNLASVIAQLEDSYSTVANKILGTGLEVAKAGAAYDVSAQQALGLAAAFDSIGTEAELSRSAVVSVFGEMSKAIATNSPKLATFATLAGQSVEDFSSGFEEDAVGGFQGFIEGLDQLIQQGGQAGLVLADLGLGSKRLQPTLLTLAKDSQRLGDVLKTASEEFETGAKLEREFEAGSDRLSAALGRMSNTFSVVVDNILDDSTGFAGALRQTVETGTDVLRVLAGMDDQVRGNATSARLLAGGVIALTGALAAYATVQAAATAGALALSAATLATPFAAVALAVGAASGALFVFKDSLVDLGDDSASVGALVGAAFDEIGKTLAFSLEIASKAWPIFRDSAIASVLAVGNTVEAFLNSFGTSGDSVMGSVVDVFKTGFNRMIGFASGLVGVMADNFGRIRDTALVIWEFMSRAWKSTVGFFSDVFGGSISDMSVSLSKFGGATAATFSGIVEDVQEANRKLQEMEVPKDLGEASLKQLGIKLAQINNPVERVNSSLAIFREQMKKDFIGEFASGAESGFTSISDKFIELRRVATQSLVDLGFNPDEIEARFAGLFDAIKRRAAENTFGPFIPTPDPSKFGPNPGPPVPNVAEARDLAAILDGNAVQAFGDSSTQSIQNIIFKTEDLGFALEHALDLGVDQRKALALRDLGFELDAAGANADEAATFLNGFGTAIDRLDQLDRIKNISREFAAEMGGAFKGLITGAQSFEESINSLGRAISDIALDRFLIDPFVDNLTGALSGIGADLTAEDPKDVSGAGALADLLEPSNLVGESLGVAALELTKFTTALSTATGILTDKAIADKANSFIGPKEAFVGPLEDTATAGITGAESALGGLQAPTIGASTAMGTAATAATGLATALAAAASAATGSAVADAAGTVAGAASESALGNLFSGSGIHRFAQGGAFAGGRGLRGSIGDMLTNGPVSFPLGVAGEAGPEAILEAMKFGGGFGVKGILGNDKVNVGLTRDSSGSLVVDLGTLKQKARPFKDGAAFNRGFTPPVSRPSGRGAARQDDESRGAGPTYITNQTYNIKTPDPKSFGRSLKQQRTDASRALGSNRRPN